MADLKDTFVQDIMVSDRPGAPIDGRTMRRTKNRSAVIDALLELMHEGDFEPGAATIAERAGVSHRSVFRYFDDLGDLVRTAVAQEFEYANQLADVPDLGQGTTGERIERFVGSRISLWSYVNDAAILARIKSLSIPNIDAAFIQILETFRQQVELHFADDIARFAPDERNSVVELILVMSSHDGYSYHRRLLQSDDHEISVSWSTGLAALLRP